MPTKFPPPPIRRGDIHPSKDPQTGHFTTPKPSQRSDKTPPRVSGKEATSGGSLTISSNKK